MPAELVLRKLGSGMGAEAVLADHPRLGAADIQAAQAFAADYLADEELTFGRRMRWLADERVAAALVAALRDARHDVAYIAEISSGLSDTEALALARDENRLFLTEDKDFGELVFRFYLEVPGLVLRRIDAGKPHLRWNRLETITAEWAKGCSAVMLSSRKPARVRAP